MSVEVLNKTNVTSDISIVVPIRNLERWRIKNLLSSIRQNSPTETILSDYGSNQESLKHLMELSVEYDATLLHVETDGLWSRGLANNIGIRRSIGSNIIVIDGDVIMEPNVIEDSFRLLKDGCFVIRQPVFLDGQFNYNSLSLPEDYDKLRLEKEVYMGPSLGAFLAAPKSKWFELRGYDERMRGWGSGDWEIRWRLMVSVRNEVIIGKADAPDKRYGVVPPQSGCNVYHQWHVEPSERLGLSKELFDYHKKANQLLWGGDLSIIRNDEHWGLMRDEYH